MPRMVKLPDNSWIDCTHVRKVLSNTEKGFIAIEYADGYNVDKIETENPVKATEEICAAINEFFL